MRYVMVFTAVLLAAGAARADDFELVAASQTQFRGIAEDVTGALSPKALHSAEAGGLTGFSVGAFASYTPTENPDAWKFATGGNEVDAIGMTSLVASKGLPFNVDVGLFYGQVPGTDAKLTGGEVRYAFLPGSLVLPALALRVAVTSMSGVDDLDFKSTSIDLSLSKGFPLLTPYAGVGRVSGKVTPKGSLALLKEEKVEETRLFVGAKLTLFPLFAITPEYERIGDSTSYNLRLGLSF